MFRGFCRSDKAALFLCVPTSWQHINSFFSVHCVVCGIKRPIVIPE